MDLASILCRSNYFSNIKCVLRKDSENQAPDIETTHITDGENLPPLDILKQAIDTSHDDFIPNMSLNENFLPIEYTNELAKLFIDHKQTENELEIISNQAALDDLLAEDPYDLNEFIITDISHNIKSDNSIIEPNSVHSEINKDVSTIIEISDSELETDIDYSLVLHYTANNNEALEIESKELYALDTLPSIDTDSVDIEQYLPAFKIVDCLGFGEKTNLHQDNSGIHDITDLIEKNHIKSDNYKEEYDDIILSDDNFMEKNEKTTNNGEICIKNDLDEQVYDKKYNNKQLMQDKKNINEHNAKQKFDVEYCHEQMTINDDKVKKASENYDNYLFFGNKNLFKDDVIDITSNNSTDSEDERSEGYHSSDFESISESEAHKDGLIINVTKKARYNSRNRIHRFESTKNILIEKISEPDAGEIYFDRKCDDKLYLQKGDCKKTHKIPEGDDFLDLFKDYCDPESGDELTEVVDGKTRKVKFNAGTGLRDKNFQRKQFQYASSKGEDSEEVKETIKMIMSMYPEENAIRMTYE